MIYSVHVSESTLSKDPSLLSKVRRDAYGYVMKRNVVAFEGKYRAYVPADDYFGGGDSHAYISDVLTNPTWGVLYNCAKRSIKCTKDTHHVFFEGVYKGTTDPDDVTLLHLVLGS